MKSMLDFSWEPELRQATMSYVSFSLATRFALTDFDFLSDQGDSMITRVAKLLLLSAIALFYSLVVLNNTTDFDSNYQFVRHVLMMDTTFPGNKGMWRALNGSAWHLCFYLSNIAWEIATTILCWWGAVVLFCNLRKPALDFNAAKRISIVALTLSMLMWLVAFLSVGAEWFLMWQSHLWNGQEAAFRMFVVVGIVFLLIVQPDREEQA
jgi:predicted small integral membrane protein